MNKIHGPGLQRWLDMKVRREGDGVTLTLGFLARGTAWLGLPSPELG